MSSLKYWFYAARPKTLPAAFVPVVTGSVLAWKYGCFQWIPALICLIFALLMQIATNFANDYFDFLKGTDRSDRLGPARAVASKWITPKKMLRATIFTLVLAFIFGLSLICYGGWVLIWVGLLSILFSYGYTGGPFPLAYHGLGDVFVFVFFGLVAVSFSFYVQALFFVPSVFVAASSVGFAAVNILVVNNYRDRETDKRSRKFTTVVLFGKRFGRLLYLFNGSMTCLLCLFFLREGWVYAAILPQLALVSHFILWRKLCTTRGTALNNVLGQTALQLIIFAFFMNLGIILS